MMERDPYPEGEYLLPSAAPTVEWVRTPAPAPAPEPEPEPESALAHVFAALLVGAVVLGTLLLAVYPL